METFEGLVLSATELVGGKKVVTLFTKESGRLSFVMPRIAKKQLTQMNLISPFTHGQYILSPSRSNLYRFNDGSIISLNLDLRNEWAHLECAGHLSSALLKSQMEGKGAPELFNLTITFLRRIPLSKNLSSLRASFLLKLLKHEGLLCSDHPLFDRDDRESVDRLANARTFDAIEGLTLTDSLGEKIQKLIANVT